MRKLLLVSFFIPVAALAQTEYSSFTATGRGGATSFVTDYQACGISPANLGWSPKYGDKKFTLGFSEMTYSIHSAALSKTELRTSIKDVFKGNKQNFTRQEKIDAAKSFTDAGLAINLDFGAFGFGFWNEKFGGMAFRINDRFQWYSKLGQNASDLLFLGKTSNYFDTLQILSDNGLDTSYILNNAAALDTLNTTQILNGIATAPKLISELLKDTELSLSWTREWNVSYGRKLFGDSSGVAMYAGIGFKYIQGLGMMSIQTVDGKLEAFSSLSPVFQIDYDSVASLSTNQILSSSNFPPKQVGKGYGVDFGVSFVIKNKIRLSASLINMGSVTWSGNVYTVKDTLLVQTNNEGANNYNFVSDLQGMVGKNGVFKMIGEKERVVKLPSMLRFGGSFMIGKKAEIGVDAVMPFNEVSGSYERGIIGVGGDLMVTKWLRLSAGFMTGGNYDFQIPLGLTIVGGKGTYECGIASRDAVTFFAQNGPTLSLSTGFMRFRF